MEQSNTFCSVSSPQGMGAIAVVRVSGNKAFAFADTLFHLKSAFMKLEANKAQFAELWDHDALLDQVVVVKYFAPHSYTGDDMVEISCHGSVFIQKRIVELLIEAGCSLAKPGEFTLRAFLNHKMDLPQAEAVADLIESQSETFHHLAVNQLKGCFSKKMEELRKQFVSLAALLELELDFSEEHVEFADRNQLYALLSQIKEEVHVLIQSFKLGNVLKNGIPVAIIGKPNVGKSTLLNALLKDDRAIVSHIPGTTRDTIEDVFTIDGTAFRFIDTAGIHATENEIENFGIERTYKAIEKADVILLLIDITKTAVEEVMLEIDFLQQGIDLSHKELIIVANKIDELEEMPHKFSTWNNLNVIYISAKRKVNIEAVEDALTEYVDSKHQSDKTVLTNARHYEVMLRIEEAVTRIEDGLKQNISTDLLAVDVREALHYLGMVTGQVSNSEILDVIFSKFCIGK